MRFPEANTAPKRVVKFARYYAAYAIGIIANKLSRAGARTKRLAGRIDFDGEFNATFGVYDYAN